MPQNQNLFKDLFYEQSYLYSQWSQNIGANFTFVAQNTRKSRDCLQNIDSKMSGFVCVFFVAEIYPDLAFSLYVFPVLSSWVGKPEPV